jgi:hypothetical protein
VDPETDLPFEVEAVDEEAERRDGAVQRIPFGGHS